MERQSRFGMNLLAQFFLAIVTAGIAQSAPSQIADILNALAVALSGLFAFGLFYGFFRLLGANVGALETLYNSFPIGWNQQNPPMSNQETDPRPSSQRTIQWSAICSFTTLRYAGVLLMVTAAFSLLFTIEWNLMTKIIVAAGASIALLIIAIVAKRSHRDFAAALAALASFALLQFTLTLLYQYMNTIEVSPLLQNVHTWLFVKLGCSLLAVPLIRRFPADTQALAAFVICYASPFTLQYAGGEIALPMAVVYLAFMGGFALWYGMATALPSVWIASAMGSFGYLNVIAARNVALGGATEPLALLAIIASVAFLIVHVTMAGIHVLHNDGKRGWIDLAHVILVHVFMVLTLLNLQGIVPYLQGNVGIGIFLVGACAFCLSLATRNVAWSVWHETTVNLAIIFSAAGLFMQVSGPWSAVGFLLYACAVLWFSLYQISMRTRVYGFLLLIVSIVKLYLQFSEIFNSVPGSLVILCIGGFLVFLSYKFQDLEKIIRSGLR
jgi:hypothetical protein